MPGHLQGSPSSLGVVGTITAWTECDDWLAAVRRTIAARLDQLARRLVGGRPVGATRLAPSDLSRLARLPGRPPSGDDPAEVLLERFGVALSSGPKFGANGAGFARINVATSEQILDQVIDRIADAVDQSSIA